MGDAIERIGIIAGAGSLPLEVARSIMRQGGEVHVIMVEGAADPALSAFPHTIVNWAQPGRAMVAFRRANIKDAVLLGGYGRPSFVTARPDLTFLRLIPAVVKLLKAGGDDAVLRGVLAQFEALGLHIRSVGDVAPELLVTEGCLTKVSPAAEDSTDIARGFDLVAALGRYDIGQAVVVSCGKIEAIEGAEGTDRMLKRVAETRNTRGMHERLGTLVKQPKPGQDMRVDLPTVGPNTIKYAAAAGLAGIAVMADHVLVVNRQEMTARAEEYGLFVVGIKDECSKRCVTKKDLSQMTGFGAIPINASAERDRSYGADILSVLGDFGGGSAVVIDHGRVLAVGISEDPLVVLARVGQLRGENPRRGGIAVLGVGSTLSKPLVAVANAAGLCGVIATGNADTKISPAILSWR